MRLAVFGGLPHDLPRDGALIRLPRHITFRLRICGFKVRVRVYINDSDECNQPGPAHAPRRPRRSSARPPARWRAHTPAAPHQAQPGVLGSKVREAFALISSRFATCANSPSTKYWIMMCDEGVLVFRVFPASYS